MQFIINKTEEGNPTEDQRDYQRNSINGRRGSGQNGEDLQEEPTATAGDRDERGNLLEGNHEEGSGKHVPSMRRLYST